MSEIEGESEIELVVRVLFVSLVSEVLLWLSS